MGSRVVNRTEDEEPNLGEIIQEVENTPNYEDTEEMFREAEELIEELEACLIRRNN